MIKRAFNLEVLKLICGPKIPENQIKRRNNQRVVSVQRAVVGNAKIKKLQAEYSVDTTHKSSEQIMDIVAGRINELTGRKGKRND